MRKVTTLLVLMLLTLIPAWQAAPAAAQTADDPQAALDALVADYAQGDAALVVQVTTPEGRWASAAGLAAEDQPTTVDDRFRIASMSKTFVSTLTLLLVEEGVFALDDLASAWLPDEVLENLANADQVTLRQLLSMRSGVPDYLGTEGFWEAVQADPYYAWTPLEALAYAYDEPALFAPDEDFSYSNSNYLLMQIILEDATGEPLHTLTREYLLEPLELENTYTQVQESMDGGWVQSFLDYDEDGTPDDVTLVNDGAGMGDGALISNTADITAFYQALLQDQTVLSEDSMAELLDFQEDHLGSAYSLGLASWELGDLYAWGHSGGVLGYSSIGLYLPEHETILVVLTTDMSLDLLALITDFAAQFLD